MELSSFNFTLQGYLKGIELNVKKWKPHLKSRLGLESIKLTIELCDPKRYIII